MRVFRVIVRKEFLQLRRDRKMLPLVLIAPVLQLVLLGFAADLDVKFLPTAVLDNDHSTPSRQIIRSLESSEYFRVREQLASTAEVEDALMTGRVDLAVVIPRGYGAGFHAGSPPDLQVLIDGTNSTVGTAASNYAVAVLARSTASDGGDGPPASGATSANGLDIRSRVWFNPTMETRNFMVPGILAILLMLITMVLSSLAIVKEKELGTLEQLNVTPISSRQMILGKLVPFAVVGMVDVLLVLIVSQVVFAVPLRGSVVLVFLSSVLFLASTLGLGLLISTVAETQQQAMLTAAFFFMIPMFFLSGFAFPLDSMPESIRWVSYLFPLRYYLIIIRGIFLKGAGLSVLWLQFALLAVFGVLINLFAASRFHKTSR